MILILAIIIFILGIILLGIGGELTVNSSLNLAKKLKLSGIAVGAVFIAFITALPETFISLLALRKSQMLAFGNLVGSNIINIPLAIGLPVLITTLTFSKFARKISLIMIISALFAFLFLFDGRLSRWEGFLLLIFYLIWVIYVIKKERNSNHQIEVRELSNLKTALLFFVGGSFLLSGAYLIVESALRITQGWGISELYVGTNIVALGSILPETAVSFIAVFKKQGEISIGNILGDNIFTMFVVLGLVGILKPLTVTKLELFLSILPIIFITTILFLITLKKDRKIKRREGLVLVIVYLIILALQTIFLKRY